MHRFVVLLLVAAHLASAAQFYWVGADTNFDSAANWNGANPSDPSKLPSITDMSTLTIPFTSFVAPGTYNVGSTLKLPKNGKLVFSSAAGATTTIKLVNNPNAQTQATFNAGQTFDNKNDFSCNTNWRIGSPTGATPTYPPCLDDDAIFTKTVQIWSDQPSVNVKSVQAVGGTFTSNANLPVYQFDGIATNKFYIGRTVNECSIKNSGACFCRSSCPTADGSRAQDAILRAYVRDLAQQRLAELTAPITKNFRITIDLVLANPTVNDALTFVNTKGTTWQTEIANAFKARWKLTDNQAVSFTETSASGSQAVVAGSLTGTALAFTTPGQALATTGGAQITATFTASSVPTATWTNFQSAAYSIVAPALVRAQVEDFCTQVDSTCNNGAECTPLTAPLKALFRHFADPQAALNAICPAGTGACMARTDIVTELTKDSYTLARSAQDDSSFSRPNTVSEIATALAAVDFSVDPLATFMTNVRGFAATVKNIQGAAISASSPSRGAAFGPLTFAVGADLASNDLSLLLNSYNQEALRATLLASVSNVGLLSSLSEISSLSRNSRRRATSSLSLGIRYFAYCPSNNRASCTISTTGNLFNTVQDLSNAVTQSYTIAVPQCMNLEAATTAELWDQQCLVTRFQNLTTTNSWTRATTLMEIQKLLNCSYLGRQSNGECYAVAEDPNYAANANSIANSITYPSNNGGGGNGGSGASSSSSGGGGGAAIGAGAGGGAVLIIVIVVVVVMRRRGGRGGASSKKGDDRTVVAFENPMYDDPAKAGDGNVVYDQGENIGHDDGLYDEPAYNTSAASVNKSNPLYSSAENLAGGGAEQAEEGGYLDVAPEDQDNGDE